jgi:hypothetical protein
MGIDTLLNNIMHPPVLFFFLGLLAVAAKSDLEIPPQIGKFLSLYLLFDIGIKGGEELFHSGFSPIVFKVVIACLLLSFFIPFIVYKVLRMKLDIYNAGAIAAAYGSISAVTFATSVSFLESSNISFGGYMVAGMALMESPAIIAGLILIGLGLKGKNQNTSIESKDETSNRSMKSILHEACFNGSVFLLIGSLVIGLLAGTAGEEELKPFVTDIFKGMLSLYMLDMGLLAGKRLGELKKSGSSLILFALLYPIVFSFLGIGTSYALGLQPGDALLLTVLTASASYIAVPAAMRISVPKANMSLLLPMSLGITFTFNVTLGIPMYFSIITKLWG